MNTLITRALPFYIVIILLLPTELIAATGTANTMRGTPAVEENTGTKVNQSDPLPITIDESNDLSTEIDKPAITKPEIDTESTALGTISIMPQFGLRDNGVDTVIFKERESVGVVDVIGNAWMDSIGASSAIEALSRVSGVTTSNDKFIVIRGQPARYTYTLWNGSPLPSPDPIQRIVPLDIFPTGILESIVVQKSYTADRSGAFAGGLVALDTRESPDEAFIKVAVEGGYNTVSTGENGLVSEDDARSLPSGVAAVEDISALSASQQIALGQSFANNWSVESQSLLPDFGLTLSGGKGFEAGSGEFGVLGLISYDRKARLKETTQRSFAIGAEGQLVEQSELQEQTTDINTGTVAFLTLNGNWGGHSITSNTFYVYRTTDRVDFTSGLVTTSDAEFVNRYLLGRYERELQAQQYLGEHLFDSITLNWRAMLSQAERNVPDQRTYTYRLTPDNEFVFFADAAAIRRYSFNEDKVTSLGVDAEIPLILAAWGSFDLTAGADYYDQSREAGTRRFRFAPQLGPGVDPSAPAGVILAPGNIGDSVDFFEVTLPNDRYSGTANVTGVYLQGDLHLGDDWRVVAGARSEQAEFAVSTTRALGGGQEQVAAGFDNRVILPSMAVTWTPLEPMQLRLTASETVSRPNLNELSPATYFDLNTGVRYV
ncbi:MAG TPA: TonB-dependent receptor, partial [Gammaproteobacteria bacterium]|nr:TonB-dependent receptor [Gammaproteobacteria bacterium]